MLRNKTYTVMLTGNIEFRRILTVSAVNENDAIKAATSNASGGWTSTANTRQPLRVRIEEDDIPGIFSGAPVPQVVEVEDPAEAAVRLAGSIIADALMAPISVWAAEEPTAPVGYVEKSGEVENKAMLIALALAGVKPLPADFATEYPDVVAAIRTITDARDGKAV